MPNTNLENSKVNMKTRIRNRVQAGQTPRDLGRLAKSARFVGLTDDAEIETDIDTQMAAAIPTASIDELVEMSEGLAELRTGNADMGRVSNTDNVTEGGNKFLKAANVQPALSVSGDLSYDSGVVSYTAPTSSALQVVATVGDLPTGASPGDQAVVQSNNKLYIRTADGWYAVALINTAPSVSGNDASYTLAEDGTPTVITMIATDPENDPVTFSYAVTAGALNGTTVVQNDNVFTITPHASNPATFELTFSANDTVNVATSSASSFTLSFGMDWAGITKTWFKDHVTGVGDLDGQNWGEQIAVMTDYIAVKKQWGNAVSVLNKSDGTFVGQIAEPNSSWFATDIAGSGNILAVGDPYSNKVYLYDFSAGFTTSRTVIDKPEGGNNGNPSFGSSVAMDGDLLVVGANKYYHGSYTDQGRAYGYDVSNPSSPSLSYTIYCPQNTGYQYFGDIVIISGDYIAVSFPGNDPWYNNTGSASIHNRADGTLAQRAGTDHSSLRSTDYQGVYFGRAGGGTGQSPATNGGDGTKRMAFSGDRLVLSSPSAKGTEGAVVVFDRVSGNPVANITNPSQGTSEGYRMYGASVFLEGDTLFVSDPDHSQGDGRVYIFDLDENNNATLIKTIEAPQEYGSRPDGQFGSHIKATEDSVYISSRKYPAANGDVNSGAVFKYS